MLLTKLHVYVCVRLATVFYLYNACAGVATEVMEKCVTKKPDPETNMCTITYNYTFLDDINALSHGNAE